MEIGNTVIIKFQEDLSLPVVVGEVSHIGSMGLTVKFLEGGDDFFGWDEIESISTSPDVYQELGATTGRY